LEIGTKQKLTFSESETKFKDGVAEDIITSRAISLKYLNLIPFRAFIYYRVSALNKIHYPSIIVGFWPNCIMKSLESLPLLTPHTGSVP